ncbi:MAG: glycosyltransferase family 2 protein [Rhodospirillales bacterium]|nr:glycosyltransferase family 2 protein [Rhodospirillales bacterium]
MIDPRVSIVIPCFNGGADLAETLASLEAQTYRNFEVLIVDDGSTDPATIAYLDSLPSPYRVLRQANHGLPAARNAGLRAAQGRFLLPLDCDDLLAPEFLRLCLAALESNPDAGFAFTQMRLIGELKGVTRKRYNPFAQLFLNQLPYCLFLRHEAWEQAGGYDETMRQGYEDWEFNIRLAKHGFHGVALDPALFVYRVRAGGMLNSVSRSRHAALWRLIQRKHPDLYRLRALRELRRAWNRTPLPYPAPLLFALLAAHRLLPGSIFNLLYSKLLTFSAARRTKDDQAA